MSHDIRTEAASGLPTRVGVFDRYESADRAVESLADAGFAHDQITVICPTCAPGVVHDAKQKEPAGAHAPAAASVGSAIGVILGGLVPLAGIVATGGVGLLAAGPLLAGAAGGAVAGGFVGAMLSRGFDTEMANFYDQALEKGKVLVGVDCKGDGEEARLATAERILAEAGAETLPLTRG
jgi:hypothetical protein